jgi:uncharacterized membrane protein
MAAGVLIRHFFNLKHKGRIVWGYPAAGVALLLLVAIAIAPKPAARPQAGAGAPAADFNRVQAVIAQRCVVCHADKPTQPGFAAAPAGVMLHRPELIRQHADRIYRQTVQLKSMPIGNLTNMTEEERALIGRWYEGGAK